MIQICTIRQNIQPLNCFFFNRKLNNMGKFHIAVLNKKVTQYKVLYRVRAQPCEAKNVHKGTFLGTWSLDWPW